MSESSVTLSLADWERTRQTEAELARVSSRLAETSLRVRQLEEDVRREHDGAVTARRQRDEALVLLELLGINQRRVTKALAVLGDADLDTEEG